MASQLSMNLICMICLVNSREKGMEANKNSGSLLSPCILNFIIALSDKEAVTVYVLPSSIGIWYLFPPLSITIIWPWAILWAYTSFPLLFCFSPLETVYNLQVVQGLTLEKQSIMKTNEQKNWKIKRVRGLLIHPGGQWIERDLRH